MKNQSGSAIVMLFIAVALFGSLAYAFMKGSRTSTSMMTNEKSTAEATTTQGQAMITGQAVKRLKLRGCKDSEISYETPAGNNPNPSAPADGRCHVYRVNGGGVRFIGVDTAFDPCTTGPVGTACTDGAVYVGVSGGNRIYAAGSNPGSNITWGGNGYSVATSTSDGKANTDLLVTGPGGNTYPAALACRAMGASWYLPSYDELHLLYTSSTLNGGTIDLNSLGISTAGHWYWSSSQQNSTNAHRERFNAFSQSPDNKTASYRYHCVRQ